MNLTVSPIRSNSMNNKPAFKGYDDDYKVDYKTYKNDLSQATSNGVIGGSILGIVTGLVFGGLIATDENKQNAKNLDKFIYQLDSISRSKDIKQDTFMVKDMNKDKNPDFVLFKKDGSKVVIDIKNQKILQETKKLDVIN